MSRLIRVMAGLTVLASCGSVPIAHADGISECKESPDKLRAMAQTTIDMMVDHGVTLGTYEDANTVLQYVNASLSGVDTQMPCADIMAIYEMQRENGTMRAPIGHGLR
jgi:hypothetical protein